MNTLFLQEPINSPVKSCSRSYLAESTNILKYEQNFEPERKVIDLKMGAALGKGGDINFKVLREGGLWLVNWMSCKGHHTPY